MDKIRLKLAIILATIFFTGNAFSQTTMKELIGLPIDSIGFKQWTVLITGISLPPPDRYKQ